jgi:hypothetical protein
MRSTAAPQPVCCGSTLCCQGSAQPNDCCPPSTCSPQSLTIGALPDPSNAGQKVVISGSLLANPRAVVQVVLWRKLARQSGFQQFAQTTTDSSAGYTFTMPRGTVMADQQWYVTSGSLQSPTITQRVRALVGLVPAAASSRSGQPIGLHGRVTPSHAGELVLIEQRLGGAWQVIARPRLGRGSSYTISHRFGQSGTMKLRAVFRGDARNVWSTSRTVALTVTP